MKTVTYIALGALITLSQPAMADPSINNMQGCQALIDFIDAKLGQTSYDSSDVAKVQNGLGAYNSYIQNEIITPGLLKFSNGDQGKAAKLQEQVDAFKSQVVAGYNKKYPQDRIFMDHVVALNNCTQQAVPKGADLEALKTSMETMVTLAQSG
ncbi:hypothetical protein WH95_00325 [Kiloniella litopenaei]|uniref:Uncharacterized protein n=1 Tax=Kiloniella litopenaei TaxID=1549748 RepID=A0A0M2R9R4_9PROT|nr:hypothetical protein [Kiloniella litopenaei]KKJ78587.1 hypothetical protein WH95_00325 [Kiloniella litopenaei]